MAYNDKSIKRDINGNPIPQEYNALTDSFEVLRATIYLNSTEAKPTENVIKGDTLFEIDTATAYIYDGTKWVRL